MLHLHRQTDRLNNGTLYAPRYEVAFLPIGKKMPRSLRSLGLASLLVERYMRQGCFVLAVGACAFDVEKQKNKTKCHQTLKKHTTKHIHSSPATATTSRRRATRHIPRGSPYTPASIDPGFVELGLVQPSQSTKTTNVTHTLTDTDRQTDGQTS